MTSSSNRETVLKVYHCEPCRYERKEVNATHYCLDCKQPQPLCPSCGKEHLKQKLGRGHRLSQNMQQFGALLWKSRMQFFQQPFSKPRNNPGKPFAAKIRVDSVKLRWQQCDDVDCYQIRYKRKSGQENWKIIPTNVNNSEGKVEGLMADTTYIFQVRGVKGDTKGPFSEANDEITTRKSYASHLLDFAVKLTDGNPSTFELPLKENLKARNTDHRIRHLCLGDDTNGINREEEKSILLIGAIGSGKSMFLDGIVNYLTGVFFEDPFRFTLGKLKDDSKQENVQKEWLTVYKITPHKGSRLDYTLNIIDASCCGNTNTLDRRSSVVGQISHLFRSKGDGGLLFLDSVCFVVKASDGSLTSAEEQDFTAIMSLFGKDIESNICTLITFADGADPPVLACLEKAKLLFRPIFHFNNCSLYTQDKNRQKNALTSSFWKMGDQSFEAFFQHLKKLETKSLTETKVVLFEREQLKTIINHLSQKISEGLSQLSELREQLVLFRRCKEDIHNNKDFTYEVEQTRPCKRGLAPGQHVTNCMQCNITCHENCKIADDSEKMNCWAMTDGYCRICSQQCCWDQHKNTPYIFSFATETVTKTYKEMKESYEKAIGRILTHERYLEELATAVDKLMIDIMEMIKQMNRCKTRLKEIALRPNSLSIVEYIKVMIQAERLEKQQGCVKRIALLEEMKRIVERDCQNFGSNLRSSRDCTKTLHTRTSVDRT